MDPTLLLWILAALLVLAGLAGLVVPFLPGAPLLLAGLVVAAWAEGFQHVGIWAIVLMAVLALLTYVADILAGAVGARRFGASPRSMAGATVGAVVGIFFGLPGVLLGPFMGALLGEYAVRRDLRQAGRAGIGATVGLAIAVAAKVALAFSMLGVFVLARFLV
jgi:uncharacterized protein YqgC (DUF456 family)